MAIVVLQELAKRFRMVLDTVFCKSRFGNIGSSQALLCEDAPCFA